MDIVSDAVVDEGAPSSNATNPILNPQPEPIGAQKESVAEETPPVEKVDDPIPKGVQKRIDRAVRQKYEAEARAKALEEQLQRVQQYQQPQQQKVLDNSEPKIENFDNFDEYVAAKAEYIAGKKIEATLTEREKRQSAEREAAERRKTADSWQKRMAAATAEMPDFEEVLASSDVPMTPPMQQAIMESEVGTKLAYYLAMHPDEAEQIAGMSPIGAIRTLGRIEERLATAKPTVTTTNAPPPLKPIGAKAVVSKDPGKMSDAEYEKWRKSGRAA